MAAIEPTPAQMQAFASLSDDGPLVMINLLRYRERAAYPADRPERPCTGREAYGRYSEAVAPLLDGAGGRPLWLGHVRGTVIAPEGEAWDDAILVHYPSRSAALGMFSSPEYRAIMHHRTAALADSRLIATTGTWVPETPSGPTAT